MSKRYCLVYFSFKNFLEAKLSDEDLISNSVGKRRQTRPGGKLIRSSIGGSKWIIKD